MGENQMDYAATNETQLSNIVRNEGSFGHLYLLYGL